MDQIDAETRHRSASIRIVRRLNWGKSGPFEKWKRTNGNGVFHGSRYNFVLRANRSRAYARGLTKFPQIIPSHRAEFHRFRRAIGFVRFSATNTFRDAWPNTFSLLTRITRLYFLNYFDSLEFSRCTEGFVFAGKSSRNAKVFQRLPTFPLALSKIQIVVNEMSLWFCILKYRKPWHFFSTDALSCYRTSVKSTPPRFKSNQTNWIVSIFLFKQKTTKSLVRYFDLLLHRPYNERYISLLRLSYLRSPFVSFPSRRRINSANEIFLVLHDVLFNSIC